MTRHWRALMTVAFCTAVFGPGPAATAEQVEDVLPEDAFLLVKLADWPGSLKDAEGTALGKIAAEGEVKEYLAGPGKVLEKLLAALEKQTGLKRDDFRKAFGSEIALAMPGLEKRQGAGQGDAPAFALALLARVGEAEAADRAAAAIRALLKGAAEEAGETCQELSWGAVQVFRAGPEDPEDEDPSAYLFRAGNWQALALANSQARVRLLAEGLAAGRCAAPLSASAEYRQCRAMLGERADLVWYFSVKKLADQVLARLDEKEQMKAMGIMEALKVFDLPALAGSVAVEPPGFRSRLFLACKPGEEGIPGLLGAGPLDPEMLRLAPANSMLAHVGWFHFDRLVPLIRKVGDAVEAGGAEEFNEDVLGGFKKEFGFDMQNDLWGLLGGRYGVFILSPKAVAGNPLVGELNGLVMVAEVRDAAALRGTAEKLTAYVKRQSEEEGGNVQVSSFDYRGAKVTCINAGLVSPGFAVTDKHLLVGVNVQAVKKLLAQGGAGGEEAGLAGSEAFKKALAAARLDLKGACGVSFVDTAALAEGLIGKLGMAGGMANMFGGFERRPVRAASAGNLRQIGLACCIYADDNDEKFPARLADLLGANKKVLLCPGYAKHAADGVDYAYVSGLRAGDAVTFILAYEALPGKDGKVNALFVDAHVESLTPEELKKKLDAQLKALKEAKREAKLVEPGGVERGEAEEPVDLEGLAMEFFKQVFNPAAMPSPEAVTRHLFPGVAVTRPVEGGILEESFTPTGVSPNAGRFLGLGAAAGMVPFFMFSRAMAAPRAAAPLAVQEKQEPEADDAEAVEFVPAPAPAPVIPGGRN